MTISFEGLDEEEKVPVVINNNINVVNDSHSDSSEEDFENNEENFFHKTSTIKLKFPPQTTVNTKVVQACQQNHQGSDTR